MTDTRALVIAAALAAVAYGAYWLGGARTEQAQIAQRKAARVAEHRAGGVVSVIAEQEIAPGQTVRIIQIKTGPLDDGSLDPRCLIYTDAHSSSMTCPGVQALDLVPPN